MDSESGKRSCFNCDLFDMCITRIKVDEAIRYTRVNIDGMGAPGNYKDLINSLGKCCCNFRRIG